MVVVVVVVEIRAAPMVKVILLCGVPRCVRPVESVEEALGKEREGPGSGTGMVQLDEWRVVWNRVATFTAREIRLLRTPVGRSLVVVAREMFRRRRY